jgi:hypothetical protein
MAKDQINRQKPKGIAIARVSLPLALRIRDAITVIEPKITTKPENSCPLISITSLQIELIAQS